VEKSYQVFWRENGQKGEEKKSENSDGDSVDKNFFFSLDKNKNENESLAGLDEKERVKKIEEYADFASRETGVKKEFLMGMLVVESALGTKTGECTYAQVKDGAYEAYVGGRLSERAWQTFMGRKRIIERIANKLGHDHETLKVSCNPARYVGTGGAMGVAQFMPDTWVEYESRIAKIVGKENPDPWDARDGVVAMAVKLADVPGVKDHNHWAERNAAKLYLSGTTSYQYDWYANETQYWAKNYQKLMA
jgi:membrane-bound lytic murein transglycosylase B